MLAASAPSRLTVMAACILSILPVALAVAVGAQERRAPVVRTTTRLVQLNVVVVDKKGKPVSGLSQDDFQVLDNGREQKLSHFSVSSTAVHSVPPAASPLVITNRPQGGEGESPSSMTVILVDELVDQDVYAKGPRALMQSARLAILRFLGTLQPGDQIALYALRAEGVVVVHDFTDDPAELVAAAKTLGSGLLGAATPTSADIQPPSSVGRPPAAEEIRGWLAGSDHTANVTRSGSVHRVIAGDAFHAIAEHLRDTPGRKNVVWISATSPALVVGLNPDLMGAERNTILPDRVSGLQAPQFADTESHYEELRAFARGLSSTNISVYPIDPQGDMSPTTVLSRGAEQKFYFEPPRVLPTVGPWLIGPWATMDLVASETGGRAFYDTNGIDQILRQVLDENRVAYELAYYPGDSAWDGKYHNVELKVKGDGLTVRCRKGYFAVDTALVGNAETALRDAAKSVVEALGIGLAVQIPSNPLGWTRQDVVLSIDTHDVHFDQKDGRWNAQLDVGFVQLGNDGRILDGAKDQLELALDPHAYDDAAAHGWLYRKSVEVRPQAEKLRIIVRDRVTGAVGSVSVAVRHDKAT